MIGQGECPHLCFATWMGSCCSCCSSAGLDGSRSPQLNQQSNPNQHNSEDLIFPVQFSLGQKYPLDSCIVQSAHPQPHALGFSQTGLLEKIAVPWTSQVPITTAQLERKRREFWDTAPAYGGTKEVWLAIEEAVEEGRWGNIQTAKAILSCAGITLPVGTLTEAYDERGYRYTVPPYCLCDPLNGLMTTPSTDAIATEESYDYYNLPISENEPLTQLKIRLSTGEDIELRIPTSPLIRLGHIKSLLRKKMNNIGVNISFFWGGHGPLSDSLQLCAMQSLWNDCPETPRLQAWLIPPARDSI